MADLSTETNGATTSQTSGSHLHYEGRIVERRGLLGDAALVTLAVPGEVAARSRPGQFADVLCRLDGSLDPLLRRPYSFYRVDPDAATLSLLVRPFGRGSRWLTEQAEGTTLDILGPLGNGFTMQPRAERMLMVAGGVGVAPLVHLTDVALAQGKSVTFLMGAAGEDGLLDPAELPEAVEYVVATDDGSRGHHGFVTDLVPEYLRWADQVFACGPDPMLRSLKDTVVAHRIGRRPSVQVSMERTMACGFGVCLGCVVETRSGMRTSCVDGPVYDIDEVVW